MSARGRRDLEVTSGGHALGDQKAVKRTLMVATARDNADILTEMRDIVRNQLNLLRKNTTSAQFSPKEAAILHKLAQTYAILDAKTREEHARYDYSDMSEEELAQVKADALNLLKGHT